MRDREREGEGERPGERERERERWIVCVLCVFCACVYRQKECDRCAKVKAFRPASNAEQELN